MLNIDNISYRQGAATLLKQVTLSLGRGQIGAIMGSSGAGKSTLLKAIAGFVAVESGTICFGDAVLSTADWTQEPAKREVGMVFQDLALFPHLNARANLQFGVRGLAQQELSTRLTKICELLQISALLAKFPHELSGGEQQRIAIGRTLITAKQLILLDEPFANLDSSLKRQLAFGVRDYLKEYEITALVVSHDQTEALNMCDKLGRLNQGRLEFWRDKREILPESLLPFK